MADATTRERLTKVYVEHLGVDAEKLTDDARMVEDLGADSLDMVELVMNTEEEFRVEITDDEAEAIFTFGEALVLVYRKLAEQAS